jgi:hypothetical protein
MGVMVKVFEEESSAVEGESSMDDSAEFPAEEEAGDPGAIGGRSRLVAVGEGLQDLGE